MTRRLNIARSIELTDFDRASDHRPNLPDLLAAEWAQREAPRRSLFHRAISGDCFFLITGAMVALDLCLIVWLVQR